MFIKANFKMFIASLRSNEVAEVSNRCSTCSVFQIVDKVKRDGAW